MLELIIAVFPGILALLIYRRLHQEFHLKKALAYILFYTVMTNLCILAGLKLIGMQSFHLFEMSARFKVKWIVLELVLSLLMTVTFLYIRSLSLSSCKCIFKRIFPVMLFFIITYAVFTPSALFLENINEFMLHYSNIVPILLFISLILTIGIYGLSLCIANEKILHIFIAFLFGLTLSFYVQGNFLNPPAPPLDGRQVNWTSYSKENIISISFWLVCIILCLVLSYLQKEKTEKGIKYISYFLSAVQAVTLIVLLFTTKLDDSASYGYSKESEFSVGSQENVIIFIVDTLQASTLEEYLISDAYTDGSLNDFTFFDNAVSGGASTRIALPLLITGIEYDPMQPLEVYSSEIWNETELYGDLHRNGYDVRFYTMSRYLSNLPDKTVDNYELTGHYWIDDYPGFGFQIYKLVNFYLMPQFLKQYFWLSDNTIVKNIASSNDEYKYDDVQFYHDFQAAGGLKTDYQKTFRLYHLEGVHEPYLMNENIERIEEGTISLTEQQILQGNMNILYEYIDEMKASGIYEASTIIILGDHGRHEDNNIEDNPAILLKLPYETHELAHNSAPIHFRNLTATIAGTILEDYSSYGPSVYDISETSDVERLHTISRSVRSGLPIKEADDDSLGYTRFIIYGTAGSGEYHIINPYEINRVDYPIGEIIDFATDNEYAKQINYRLYKENGAATASNELSICFALEDYQKGDLTLHFVYSNLYNDSQKIRLYANGNKTENIICTPENAGKEITSVIPGEYITDNELVIRMVFPSAVTPNQLDRSNSDMRILSVAFDSMWLE